MSPIAERIGAVNTIVKNKTGEVSSCDILYTEDLVKFNQDYLKYTIQVAENCQDRDLSADSMVIGTSAIIDTELDGAVGMNSGIFNNPFIIWGKYKKKLYDEGKTIRHPIVWELYRYLHGLDINIQRITDDYVDIDDGTIDIEKVFDAIVKILGE